MVFLRILENTALKRDPTTYTRVPTSALVTSATPTAPATIHCVLPPKVSNASSIRDTRVKSCVVVTSAILVMLSVSAAAAAAVAVAPAVSNSGVLPLPRPALLRGYYPKPPRPNCRTIHARVLENKLAYVGKGCNAAFC